MSGYTELPDAVLDGSNRLGASMDCNGTTLICGLSFCELELLSMYNTLTADVANAERCTIGMGVHYVCSSMVVCQEGRDHHRKRL